MAKLIFHLFLYAITCAASCLAAARGGDCPVANGTFPVSGQCDAYIQCINGVAEQKLCPDGLLFNEKSSGYPCAYPIDVICAKGSLQPAQPTDECPHQFGYYEMGDRKACGNFKNCAYGRSYEMQCPDDLAWNKNTYQCDWPDQVEDCDAEAFLGFKCPTPPQRSPLLGEEYRFFPDSQNCQQYFVCIEGRPRRVGCGDGHAFNPETNQCDDIENVQGCNPEVKQTTKHKVSNPEIKQKQRHKGK